MGQLRDLGRALAALGALVVLLIGVPAALVVSIGWPLPRTVPSWETVSQALSSGAVADATVLKAVALVVWVAWLQVAGAAVAEGWSLLGQRSARPAPFTLPAVQLTVGRLLSTAVLLSAVFHSRAALAAPAAPLPRIAPPPVVAPPPAPPVTVVSEDNVKEWLVHRRETLWGIAERSLGDGRRFSEIIELNTGRVQPDGAVFDSVIRPGWVLRLPADAQVEPTPAGAHRVVPGDSLSAIAEARLGEMSRWPELWELNHDRVQTDGERFSDPDLIRAGWVLQLPPTPASTTTAATSPTPDTPPTADPTTRAPAPTPTTTTTSPSVAPPTESPAHGPADIDRDPDPAESSWTTHAPTLAGLAGAVVLATGLSLRVRFLRRRQAVRGARAHHTVSTGSGRTEDAVVAAADVPLVRWAGQQLAQLVRQLDRRAVTGAPVAVEVSDTAGVELLWDTPQSDAPEGWTAADGGWAWRLAYDPDAPVPVDALPAAIPALVTIGRREHRQLMIDLEAYGAITVSGSDDQVDAFLRSVALELAAGQDLADAYVHAVGFDPGVGHLDRLATTDIDDALHHLDTTFQSVTDALDLAHLDGTFTARTGSTTPIDATIVVAHPAGDHDTERLVQTAPARRGIAVIAAGNKGTAPAHIELRDDGTARIEPLGIIFTPVALPTDSTAALDRLLDALDTPPAATSQQDVAGDQQGDATAAEAYPTNGHPPHHGNGDKPDLRPAGQTTTDDSDIVVGGLFPGEHDGDSVEPALLVRVLGTPQVPDRPDLSRRELILTVLLACRGHPVAASAAQDALWGGKPVETKTVWNVIGATRKALGDLPDGTPVMPPADRARGTLRVAPGVGTDVAVLRSLIERARRSPSSEAIGLLREGLELVAGQPFDAAGYDWAHRDQDVAEACALIEHATERLVELALDTDLVDVARDAIVRGLRGLPGNEELYRCRMRVEHHAGNLPGLRAAYEELVTYLADLETEPSLSTTALYQDLIRPVRR